MNIKVEAYLAEQERGKTAEREAYRKMVLQKAGLVEKVYSSEPQTSVEYPHYDYDKMCSYKLVYEEVTDEEFARIEQYAKGSDGETEEEGTMFSNIGKKLRTLAVTVCWLGIVISVLTGFVLLVSGEELALVGLLIAGVGSLVSWLTSLFTYGFGELIVKTTEIAENTKKKP